MVSFRAHVYAFFALTLIAACGGKGPAQHADGTFFGGSDPVAFKLRLAQSNLLAAFDRIDRGQSPVEVCLSAQNQAGCGEGFDAQDCGDFASVLANGPLLAESAALLADAAVRAKVRQALGQSRFEVVSELAARGRHSVAVAPVGSAVEPIRYLGPALAGKPSLIGLVFHENAHVAGLTDEEVRGGQSMHDILTGAGLCLQRMALYQSASAATPTPTPTPTPAPPAGGGQGESTPTPTPAPTPTPTPPAPAPEVDLSPLRNYSGRYEMEISGKKHYLILTQDAQGRLGGEMSGLPGVVRSATVSGAVKRAGAASTLDEMTFDWAHGDSYPSRFHGLFASVSGTGDASGGGVSTVSWRASPDTSLFVETFATEGRLADRAPWEHHQGAYATVENGVLVRSGVRMTSEIVNSVNRADGEVSAYVSAPQLEGDTVGLLARVKANGDYYFGVLAIQSDGRLKPELWKNDNGNLSKFASGSAIAKVPGLLSFSIRGQELVLRYDGVELLRRNESHVTGDGRFGFRATELGEGLNGLRIQP